MGHQDLSGDYRGVYICQTHGAVHLRLIMHLSVCKLTLNKKREHLKSNDLFMDSQLVYQEYLPLLPQ